MAQVYYDRDMTAEAVFELTIRSLPDGWEYLIAAGLDRTLSFFESLRFSEEDLDYLTSLPQFDNAFIDRLRDLEFTGDVWAPAEGTIVYPHEPLLQVIAPLPEAQIVETAAINQIAYPTLVPPTSPALPRPPPSKPAVDTASRSRERWPTASSSPKATNSTHSTRSSRDIRIQRSSSTPSTLRPA